MTGIKVGDFVRFKSSIILDNPQISLTGDKAVVIGFSPDGKVARVVWSDGEPGEYRREKLDRCEGAIGRAVAAPPQAPPRLGTQARPHAPPRSSCRVAL